MKNEIERLERTVGLVHSMNCTPQEDAYYAQLLKAGKPLPSHIRPDGYSTTEFVKTVGVNATDEEKRYWATLKMIEELQKFNQSQSNGGDAYRILTKLEQIRFWVSFPYIFAFIVIASLLVVYGVILWFQTL